jgi:hypothetical protein
MRSRRLLSWIEKGTLTPMELTLALHGEDQRLRPHLVPALGGRRVPHGRQAATRRRVLAFISGIDTKADVSTETFVLAPRDVGQRATA